ncbi:cupin domain-containing protein [Bradyrhizobium prioriisuperbiae]|uniref:cupin domain-containing protein n=1 Tax=Bradyrhizobium prioriisuperbiae TaxID=2854389 RepID=UPI0028E3F855|nr:cupin domain-containing protein [Bradyrhizobium prioritasuperba]
MKIRHIVTLIAGASLAALLTGAAAQAQSAGTVTPAFNHAISNIPGKSIVAVIVDYPPGGTTPAHRHAKSAFITGYVLSGAIRSQVDDGPVQVFKAGENFTEKPGAHHRVSDNASTTEPAKLLAIFVVDSSEKELTTLDGK